MDDLISRQAAIDLLKDWSGGYDYLEIETEAAIKEFQKLPSAHPEQIVAKQILWMEIKEKPGFRSYTPHCKCSNCGHELIFENINCCYVCGARFVGKEKI